ncbi:MAG: ABC transporter substrate-binding protein [Pseudomonadaceae bacterium]
MSQIHNPFTRGYQNLRIVRTLLITCEDGNPPVWRPLHPSQAHLADDQVSHCSCIFSSDFALVVDGHAIPNGLEAQCQATGVVQTVVYAINDGAAAVHIADTYSEEAAHEVVWQLTFQTGHFSRCWEISAAHVTEAAIDYLWKMAKVEAPPSLLFAAFRIPGCTAIGVKLIATPWTTDNLLHVEGITAEQLRQEHLDNGVPASLMEVLHQAAEADIRFLILDGDAPELDGLALHQG